MMRTTITALFACLLSSMTVSEAQVESQSAPRTVPGMPPVIDPDNLYSEQVANRFSPAVAQALERIYVPNHYDSTVSVIDPSTLKVVQTFKVGINPQHVVPSWDLRTLWVTNNAEGRADGSVTAIDPSTGKPGRTISVDDPYNMYWSPDGQYAIVVAEAYKRLDFRDAASMELKFTIETPHCAGINHGDFSIDGTFALFTCEFNGSITKIDLVNRRVLATMKLQGDFDHGQTVAKPTNKSSAAPDAGHKKEPMRRMRGMPQDVRVSPDGKTFFVADMMADGVHLVDGDSFKQIGFIATGVGAHG
ncbi:MAG: YVTN family beta-propeller protein, partial [Gammaproteobacteria bacterium]